MRATKTEKCRHLSTASAQATVLDFARSQGLHGVAILSPVCPTCGELHAFEMLTDLQDVNGTNDGTELADLLTHFADVALNEPTERLNAADAPAGLNN